MRASVKSLFCCDPDLDSRILKLNVAEVPGVLCRLQDLALDDFWTKLASLKEHRDLQLQLLQAQLAAVLLDRQVLRGEPVHSSHPRVTWGVQESDDYVKLDLQVTHHSCSMGAFSGLSADQVVLQSCVAYYSLHTDGAPVIRLPGVLNRALP